MMKATVRICGTAAFFVLFARSAPADLGSVYLYTFAQKEISDDLEEQFQKRLAEAHLKSPLQAEHIHFFVRVVPREEGLHYSIMRLDLVRGRSHSQPAFHIAGDLKGIKSALNEITLAFQRGSLFKLASGWRKRDVDKPVLERDE